MIKHSDVTKPEDFIMFCFVSGCIHCEDIMNSVQATLLYLAAVVGKCTTKQSLLRSTCNLPTFQICLPITRWHAVDFFCLTCTATWEVIQHYARYE